jgi:hypothetical protein
VSGPGITTNLSLDPPSRAQLEEVAKVMGVGLTETVRRSVRTLSGVLIIAEVEAEDIAEKHGEEFAHLYRRIGRDLGWAALMNKRLAIAHAEDGRAGIRVDDHAFFEDFDGTRLLAKVDRAGTSEVFEVKDGRLLLLGHFPAAPAERN